MRGSMQNNYQNCMYMYAHYMHTHMYMDFHGSLKNTSEHFHHVHLCT